MAGFPYPHHSPPDDHEKQKRRLRIKQGVIGKPVDHHRGDDRGHQRKAEDPYFITGPYRRFYEYAEIRQQRGGADSAVAQQPFKVYVMRVVIKPVATALADKYIRKRALAQKRNRFYIA